MGSNNSVQLHRTGNSSSYRLVAIHEILYYNLSMTTTNKFSFIFSNRFWSNVITSASVVLIDPNLPNQQWYVTVGKFLGLLSAFFTTVATVDRISDKKVEAAEASVAPITEL